MSEWNRKYGAVSKHQITSCRYCGSPVTWKKYATGKSYLADVRPKNGGFQVVEGAGNNFNFKPSHQCIYAPRMAEKYQEEIIKLDGEIAQLTLAGTYYEKLVDDAKEGFNKVPDAHKPLVKDAIESMVKNSANCATKLTELKNLKAMKEAMKTRCGMDYRDGQKLTAVPFNQH